ncbi:hypothetical protein AHAS_Ahas13G0398200 [Arachis hypogaea]
MSGLFLFYQRALNWPPDHISPEIKEKLGNLSFQSYRPTKKKKHSCGRSCSQPKI